MGPAFGPALFFMKTHLLREEIEAICRWGWDSELILVAELKGAMGLSLEPASAFTLDVGRLPRGFSLVNREQFPDANWVEIWRNMDEEN